MDQGYYQGLSELLDRITEFANEFDRTTADALRDLESEAYDRRNEITEKEE